MSFHVRMDEFSRQVGFHGSADVFYIRVLFEANKALIGSIEGEHRAVEFTMGGHGDNEFLILE